jgi:hypothetical protein
MSDVYLALIALGVVVMAAIQVTAIVMAIRAARRAGELASRLEQDIRPIVVNLQKVSEEAARASAQAAAQVDRLDALVTGVTLRVEETASAIQHSILQPARDALALLGGLKGMVAGFVESFVSRDPDAAAPPRDPHARPRRSADAAARAGHHHADDELFIG